MKSYFSLYRNYANFSGFMRRGAYWMAMIIHGLILIVPLYPLGRYLVDTEYILPDYYIPWVLPLWCFYFLLMIIPVLSASVRRMHTLPRSGWWLLIGLIPVIGWFIVLIWLLQKGNYEEFVQRVKMAGAGTAEDMIREAEKPRGGKWFFVVFAILAACGWFLNRQIIESGQQEVILKAIQNVNAEGLAALMEDGHFDLQKAIATVMPVSEPTNEPEDLMTPSITAEPTDVLEDELMIIHKTEIPETESEETGVIVKVTEGDIAEAAVIEEEGEISETEAVQVIDNVRVKDNALTIPIEAAEFQMGSDNGYQDEKPSHNVTLSAYRIDAYEVTNAQYALCVEAEVCTEPHETKSFRNPEYYGHFAFTDYPVVSVDWQQAEAYCEWAGGRLPTEAEWEYAAKGPEQNTFPWGNTFIAENLNYSGNGNYDTLAETEMPKDVSSFGVYNMGGNVAEWVFDRYQDNWYSVTTQETDPTGPENGKYRVIRGSSAQMAESYARTTRRFFAFETSFGLDRGFRCVLPCE